MGGEQPFIGMLLLVPYNFVPQGYAACDGSLIPISQNDALFSLIGTTYGGDGQTTFALPDLRGRVAVAQGPGYTIGQIAGSETVTLTAAQYPQHTHQLMATSQGQNTTSPSGNVLASAALYTTAAANTTMASAAISSYGGSQPHENRQPYVALQWVIALYGIYPSQN